MPDNGQNHEVVNGRLVMSPKNNLQHEKIRSLDHRGLAPYRTLRRPAEHDRDRIFVAAGEKIVRRLLESDLEVVSLLLTEEWLRKLEPLWQRRSEPIQAYLGEKPMLEELIGHTMYQGVMAVGRIPKAPSLEEILARSPRPWLFVALDGLNNAENLGVLVRNCGGFGVQALLVGETASSPWMQRTVRSSMGAIFDLHVLELTDLAATLRTLRAQGVQCVAAHPRDHCTPLSQSALAGDCCLVFGNEGDGLSASVLAACDQAAAIPMQGRVDSLNVGSAAAVFLYEASRQRGRT